MYQAFASAWLPAHPEIGMSTTFYSREEIWEMVLKKFGKREACDQMLNEHQKRLRKDYIWKRVAEVLPLEGKELGQAIVVLKTCLLWNGGVPALSEKPDRSMDKIPTLEKDILGAVLIPWVSADWQEAMAHLRS